MQKIYLIVLLSIRIVANESISINDYGAIPNDNIDDTKAIQKALDINGHITMNRGIYNVHGIKSVDIEVFIDGNGSTFKSVLDTSSGGRTSKNILTLKGDKITIKNLILDGAYTNGNAKEGKNVSSLLHIYDSNNILLDNVDTINYSSNWWSDNSINYANHKIDMYHVIYIGFSKNIKIVNMKQKGNIKVEGLLIFNSDNININGFISQDSTNIWTSLHIVASDNIDMRNVLVTDGKENQGGSSINFMANYHFILENIKTINKQGFDISNEIKVDKLKGRIIRDTSYGVFKNCYFQGQRAFYGYPVIKKNRDLTFKNTTFIPTKEGYATWGARLERGENILFNNCIFGSRKHKTYGIIMGDTNTITINKCQFINPTIAIYIYGDRFNEINITNSVFNGDEYTPLAFSSISKNGILNKLLFNKNIINNKVKNNKKIIILKYFKIINSNYNYK